MNKVNTPTLYPTNIMRRIYFEFFSFLKYQKQRFEKTPRYLLTQRVRKFLQQTNQTDLPTQEQQQYIHFLKRHLVEVYNYPFIGKYLYRRVKVYTDKSSGLKYVITPEKKRLYFKRNMTVKHIRSSYNALCLEQDKSSPHNYNFDNLSITKNSIIADIGAAEGNFSLKHIEFIKKAYIFETDRNWVEALENTFKPWQEKVVVVNKYVGNINNQHFLSLDTFFQNNQNYPSILKIDVEGAEEDVLNGSDRLIKECVQNILVCTYHKKKDSQILPDWLQKRNFKTQFSAGYMLFSFDLKPGYSLEPPYNFRRGLVHAYKKASTT